MHRQLSVESMRNLLSGNDFYMGMGSVRTLEKFLRKEAEVDNFEATEDRSVGKSHVK